MTAYVKCKGTCDKVKTQYHYFGIQDCQSAAVVPGAPQDSRPISSKI